MAKVGAALTDGQKGEVPEDHVDLYERTPCKNDHKNGAIIKFWRTTPVLPIEKKTKQNSERNGY